MDLAANVNMVSVIAVQQICLNLIGSEGEGHVKKEKPPKLQIELVHLYTVGMLYYILH